MADRTHKQSDTLTFEEALTELDQIVDALETDTIPLEDLVNHYDKGMNLLGQCQTKLQQAKQRVETINREAQAGLNVETTDASANDDNDQDPTDELF